MSAVSGQNIQWPSGVPYLVADRGTMALGVKEVVQLIPDTIVATENFEGAITGSGTWFVDTSNPHSGTKYLRSAIIGNSASTTYTFTVPLTATSLRLWYRISSELNFDFLKIYKNSISVPNVLFSTSGTANVWTQITLSLAGVTSVIFEYSKDSSSTGGLDLAGIDDLEWIIPGVPAVTNYEPLHLNNNNELKVTIGNFPVVAHLNCATDSIEICNDAGSPITISGTVNVGNFPAVAHLNCATDSIEICNDAGSPITISGTVALDAGTLGALETINIGNIPHVVVDNFPVVAHLDCSTDSVEICNDAGSPITVSGTVNVGNIPHVIVDSIPEVEIKNDSGNPIPVSFTRLNCATDSVEICNDAGSPITVSGTVNVGNIPHVVVDNFPAVAHLNCATDSVEICNDAGSPITVSGTVNVGNIPHVIVDSIPEVEIKNDSGNPVPVSFTRLNCATDSVEICNDAGSPISVTVTNLVTYVPGRRSLLGIYYVATGPTVYTTAADAATGGDFWLVNTSNTVVVYLRQARFTVMLSSLALLTALPTIRMERMTFTGAPSGTLVSPAKRDSTDAANTGTFRSANTGMTITAGNAIDSFSPPAADVIGGLLAVNAAAAVPVEQVWESDDLDGYIALRQNEGIVFRQHTAGSATENRQYWLNLAWEEI